MLFVFIVALMSSDYFLRIAEYVYRHYREVHLVCISYSISSYSVATLSTDGYGIAITSSNSSRLRMLHVCA